MYKAQYNSALAIQPQSLSIWFKIENHSAQLWKNTWNLFTLITAFHYSNIMCISHNFLFTQFDVSLAYCDQVKKQKVREIVLECSTLEVKSAVQSNFLLLFYLMEGAFLWTTLSCHHVRMYLTSSFSLLNDLAHSYFSLTNDFVSFSGTMYNMFDIT
jgi:hypothetical protein